MTPPELRALRLRKGWTQVRLDKALGVHDGYTSGAESGRFAMSEERLEKAIGILQSQPDAPEGIARRHRQGRRFKVAQMETRLGAERATALDALAYMVQAVQRLRAAESLCDVRQACVDIRAELRTYVKRLEAET